MRSQIKLLGLLAGIIHLRRGPISYPIPTIISPGGLDLGQPGTQDKVLHPSETEPAAHTAVYEEVYLPTTDAMRNASRGGDSI